MLHSAVVSRHHHSSPPCQPPARIDTSPHGGGHYLLHGAHLPVVQYLCEQGGDKEARDSYGKTPLHYASASGDYSDCLLVVQYLCEHGADKEARDSTGKTPLHWAALRGQLLVVQYPCEHGADKEARGVDGYTPLLIAEKDVKEWIEEGDYERRVGCAARRCALHDLRSIVEYLKQAV